MYRYKVTKPIATSIKRLHELRERLDRRGPLPRVWLGRTRQDLEAEAIAASTSMEGVAVTADEVRRILVGEEPREVSPEDRRLVLGYRSAMEYVLRRADDRGFEWQRELVLGLHDRVLGGNYALGAGRFREKQNRVVRASESRVVYLPPPADEVPLLVDEMCAWARDNPDLDPPVLAALLHVRTAGIHPFSDGNGRTSRVLASLAMYRGGFRLPEFTSLEEWWGSHLSSYYAAFECLGDVWEPKADVTPFVTAHVEAQVKQVEALSLRQETERALWAMLEDIVSEEIRMDRRAANALYDAFFGRSVSNEYYRRLTDVHVNTATNDLKRLAAGGLLEPSGYGRARVYHATSRLYEEAARLAGLTAATDLGRGVPLEQARGLVIAELAAKLRS